MSIQSKIGQYVIQPKNLPHLIWNPSFAVTRNGLFSESQKFVDSECLRLCEPLVPRKTGKLIRSGQLGTKIGSGELQYIAPYARYQYYSTPDTRAYDPRRGAHWFDRMKAEHKEEILRGAQKFDG